MVAELCQRQRSDAPLHFAVEQRRVDVVEFMLRSLARVEAELNRRDDRSGGTPLRLALRENDGDDDESCRAAIADALIARGASVDGELLLHELLRDGDHQGARYLVARGASVASAVGASSGDNALHVAARHGASGELCAQLADALGGERPRGAALLAANARGRTPYHAAVDAGNLAALGALVGAAQPQQLGEAMRLADNDGSVPLWLACARGAFDCALALAADAHANVGYRDAGSGSGNTLLHRALLELDGERRLRVVRFLLERGADVGARNANGRNALHAIALGGATAPPSTSTSTSTSAVADDDAVVRALLAAASSSAAAVALRDARGQSPLAVALEQKWDRLIALLVSVGGADVNERADDVGGGNTLLHRRLLARDQPGAAFLLANGADASACNAPGESALSLAVAASLHASLGALLRAGADANSRDARGRSLLRVALLAKDFRSAAALVDEGGADVNARGGEPSAPSDSTTLLHLAVAERHADVVHFLIEHGADVNETSADAGASPLHVAIEERWIEGVPLLLAAGARVDAKDARDRTPLHVAVAQKSGDLVQMLLDGSDGAAAALESSDVLGRTPFMEALAQKCEAVALQLKEAGADAERVDRAGKSLLHRAIENKDAASAMFLMSPSLQPSLSAVDNEGRTLLHASVALGLRGIVNTLVAGGADPAALDADGRTFFWHAAAAGKREIVKQCLVAWSDTLPLSLADRDGISPLMAASRAVRADIVEMLVEFYSHDEALGQRESERGDTALHLAARNADGAPVVRLLLSAFGSALLHVANNDGDTPLHLSVAAGDESAAVELVKRGAPLCVPNKLDVVPLCARVHSMTESEYQLFQRILLEYVNEPPPWLADEVAAHCQNCAAKFGFARRRHHCRHCGRIVCHDCSPNSHPIAKLNIDKDVRLCQLCFAVLSTPRASSSSSSSRY
jgi:rabankyrin-5